MIEAVNSVISNAPLLRPSAEQVNSTRAELPESVSAGPQAPFISPVVSIDLNFDTAVLQIRDSDTGDVIRQFPSQSTLEARRRVAVIQSSVIQAQESSSDGSEIGISTPQQTTTTEVSTPPVAAAQAQVAAQALSAGALTATTQTSSSESIVA